MVRPRRGYRADGGLGHVWGCLWRPLLAFPALWSLGELLDDRRHPWSWGQAACRSSAQGTVPFFPGEGPRQPFPCSPERVPRCESVRSQWWPRLRNWISAGGWPALGHAARNDGAGLWPQAPGGRRAEDSRVPLSPPRRPMLSGTLWRLAWPVLRPTLATWRCCRHLWSW